MRIMITSRLAGGALWPALMLSFAVPLRAEAPKLPVPAFDQSAVGAEASYHQVYDHCTAKYLKQAGVKTEYVRLQDKGIHGNGHMVMIEKNNLDIARVVDDWLQNNVR